MLQSEESSPFFFEPISFTLFYEKLNPDYHFVNIDIAQEMYNAWLNEFLRRSCKFYYAQYVRHHNYLLRNFRSEYNLPRDGIPSEWDLEDEWKAKYYDSGLNDHYEQFNFISEQIEVKRSNFLVSHGNMLQVAEKFLAAVKRPLTLNVINELWFNTIIDNPGDLIFDLRRLDYPRYLKSSHWAHVKSAMLLIHDAVCQADLCFQLGESWYFGDWETDIHVHHLRYDNLGIERYQDLVLLCSQHHSIWHENMKNTGSPGIEIFDEWRF